MREDRAVQRGLDPRGVPGRREDARCYLRNLEVIGEAAKHIPEEVRKRHPSVPWRKISGFRDIAAHEYFGIDTDVVWNLITHEVPALLEELKRLSA